MIQEAPFARFAADKFGDFPEAEELRELFAAYATELFDVLVEQLTEREVLAAYRAFTPYIIEEVGFLSRQYVIPADWASAMVSENPGFIADENERHYYLEWINHLIVQGGRNLFALEAEKTGPVFLSAVIDVYLPGFIDCLTPASDLPREVGKLYWCQTITLRFASHDEC